MTFNKVAPVGLSCSAVQECTEPYTYCDTFTAKCVQCSTLCRDNFNECHDKCGTFLQSVLFKENIEKTDIYNLTVMVAVTAAMTSIVLIALSVLIALKLRKRRRKKKAILPAVYTVKKEKCDIEMSRPGDLSELSAMNRSKSLNISKVSDTSPPTVRGLFNGVSLQTVTTQLSEETSPTRHLSLNSSSLSQTKLSTRRLPSEDCVQTGRINQGLDESVGQYSQVV